MSSGTLPLEIYDFVVRHLAPNSIELLRQHDINQLISWEVNQVYWQSSQWSDSREVRGPRLTLEERYRHDDKYNSPQFVPPSNADSDSVKIQTLKSLRIAGRHFAHSTLLKSLLFSKLTLSAETSDAQVDYVADTVRDIYFRDIDHDATPELWDALLRKIPAQQFRQLHIEGHVWDSLPWLIKGGYDFANLEVLQFHDTDFDLTEFMGFYSRLPTLKELRLRRSSPRDLEHDDTDGHDWQLVFDCIRRHPPELVDFDHVSSAGDDWTLRTVLDQRALTLALKSQHREEISVAEYLAGLVGWLPVLENSDRNFYGWT